MVNNIKYNTTLASYFQSKSLYLDEPTQMKPNTRKLVEQPWQLFCIKETRELLSYFQDFNLFYLSSDLFDFAFYETFIISTLKGAERISGIWKLFGLHIGNGQDFVSASNLLRKAMPYMISDYSELSTEFIKLCYWTGWTRKNIDDLNGARDWFSKVLHICEKSNIQGCDEYIKWCTKELANLRSGDRA